jgi:hypothetical protein
MFLKNIVDFLFGEVVYVRIGSSDSPYQRDQNHCGVFCDPIGEVLTKKEMIDKIKAEVFIC